MCFERRSDSLLQSHLEATVHRAYKALPLTRCGKNTRMFYFCSLNSTEMFFQTFFNLTHTPNFNLKNKTTLLPTESVMERTWDLGGPCCSRWAVSGNTSQEDTSGASRPFYLPVHDGSSSLPLLDYSCHTLSSSQHSPHFLCLEPQ